DCPRAGWPRRTRRDPSALRAGYRRAGNRSVRDPARWSGDPDRRRTACSPQNLVAMSEQHWLDRHGAIEDEPTHSGSSRDRAAIGRRAPGAVLAVRGEAGAAVGRARAHGGAEEGASRVVLTALPLRDGGRVCPRRNLLGDRVELPGLDRSEPDVVAGAQQD